MVEKQVGKVWVDLEESQVGGYYVVTLLQENGFSISAIIDQENFDALKTQMDTIKA